MTFAAKIGQIHADLSTGPDVVGAQGLESNGRLSFQGPILVGEGFRLTADDLAALGLDRANLPETVHPYVIGRDITQTREERYVIDFFGLDEESARSKHPALYQWILDRVKPMRDHVKRKNHRERWWIFGEARPGMRRALSGLRRFIVTVETSKHKPFVFLSGGTCPDHKLYVVASDDAWILGVLSSRVHATWSLMAGGHLVDRPTWTNSTCFLPFPFPTCSVEQKERIRSLGERLDTHRKSRQAQHRDLTVTSMYNVMEKLRAEETLTAKEKKIHEQGLVSVLKQIHDDLDGAVFDAYGWSHDLTDEQILEKLVALNAERMEEERRGLVRWLRPEHQNPTGVKPETQEEFPEGQGAEATTSAAMPKPVWPRKLPAQIASVRDLVSNSGGSWTVEQVAGSFKGARRTDVAAVLESLAALGVVLSYGDRTNRKWRRVGKVAA